MQLYIETYWNGTGWTDLHDTPLPFRRAPDHAIAALLSGRRTTRPCIVGQAG